jgi:hypothetical protein
MPVWALVGTAVVSVLFLIEASLQAFGTSMLDGAAKVLGRSGRASRMDAFRGAPAGVRDDLLYLSFLDSLARDGRALPRLPGADPQITLPRELAAAAGLTAETQAAWGLRPPDEPDHGPRNELFRELHRRGNIILPMQGASLWDHVREREVHPGFVIFGCRSPGPRQGRIDFCGVLSVVNWLQPQHSAIIYRDPRTGEVRHTSVEAMPTISYYGSGRVGDSLPMTYMQYFRLTDHRGQKSLYGR